MALLTPFPDAVSGCHRAAATDSGHRRARRPALGCDEGL